MAGYDNDRKKEDAIYSVCAYDKDNDTLFRIMDVRSEDYAREMAARISVLIAAEQLLGPDAKPYDWAELRIGDRRMAVYADGKEIADGKR